LWLRDNSALLIDLDSRLTVSTEIISSGVRPDIAESIRSILTISNLNEDDSGGYSCKASSSVGMDAVLQSPYQLTVTRGTYGYLFLIVSPHFCDVTMPSSGVICDTKIDDIIITSPWAFQFINIAVTHHDIIMASS